MEEATQIIREKSKVSGSNVKTHLGLGNLLNNAQFSTPICSSGAAQQKAAKGCLWHAASRSELWLGGVQICSMIHLCWNGTTNHLKNMMHFPTIKSFFTMWEIFFFLNALVANWEVCLPDTRLISVLQGKKKKKTGRSDILRAILVVQKTILVCILSLLCHLLMPSKGGKVYRKLIYISISREKRESSFQSYIFFIFPSLQMSLFIYLFSHENGRFIELEHFIVC